MAGKKLHPTVEQFKDFVKEHPLLVKSVRQNEHNWQELFEDWYLLGGDDPRWLAYREDGAKRTEQPKKEEENKWMKYVTGALKNMDPSQMQAHINNLSGAIGAIQGVLAQFGSENKHNAETESVPEESSQPRSPFFFRKD